MFNRGKIFAITFSLFCLSNLAIAAEKPTQLLNIETWQAPGGAQVYFHQIKQLPIVDIQIIFDAGSARDGEQAGLAALTNSLLPEGTSTLNANEIADNFDKVGAQFGSSISRDMASFNLRSLNDTSYLTTALETLQSVLSQASFPDEAFTRVKNQQLRAIEYGEQSPATIVENAFYHSLYDDKPYAHPISGDKKTVDKLTISAVKDFYKTFYVSANAKIVIVGDVNKEQAGAIAEQLIGGLDKGKVAPTLKAIKSENKSLTKKIDFPSQQTHIRIGNIGINKQNPDFFPLYVGNHILGGSGLTSLLFDEVREKNGLAYSVYSYFSTLAENGPFMIGMQTRNSKSQAAIDITLKLLNNFIKKGPTAEQLKMAKQNIIGSFPLRLDSNKDISGYLALMAFYDLPLDYLDTFRRNIELVTQTQVQQAFEKHVDPEALTIITVGQDDAKKTQ